MKANKKLLFISALAIAGLGTIDNASADVVLKAQNGGIGSIPNPETTIPAFGGESPSILIPGFDTSLDLVSSIPGAEGSIPGVGGGTDKIEIMTYFVDERGKELSAPVEGMQQSIDIPGYVLVKTTLIDNQKWTHVYSGKTTVNFTAKYNDGRPDAHYSWTFPANTDVTYGRLFQMAGLNPDDFNLGDYDFAGNL